MPFLNPVLTKLLSLKWIPCNELPLYRHTEFEHMTETKWKIAPSACYFLSDICYILQSFSWNQHLHASSSSSFHCILQCKHKELDETHGNRIDITRYSFVTLVGRLSTGLHRITLQVLRFVCMMRKGWYSDVNPHFYFRLVRDVSRWFSEPTRIELARLSL